MGNKGFIRPPSSEPLSSPRFNSRKPGSVWSLIQQEQKDAMTMPSVRLNEQQRAELILRARNIARSPQTDERDDTDGPSIGEVFEVRSKIDSLLDEYDQRAYESEANLTELRLILEKLRTDVEEEPILEPVDDASKYIGQVQDGQERLQESISYLVKGAAHLFVQRAKVRAASLESEITDLRFKVAQIDEQIKLKSGILEEKIELTSRMENANSGLRRRIETTKDEIRAIAGNDYEQIPMLAAAYDQTLKEIMAEETSLNQQLWALQSQIATEQKDQVQVTALQQRVKDFVYQKQLLQNSLDDKAAALKAELSENEKNLSQKRSQFVQNFLAETRKLISQARRKREEELFNLKASQLEKIVENEKQAREDKIHILTADKTANDKTVKSYIQFIDREDKQLHSGFDQEIKRLRLEFAASEKRAKRENEKKLCEISEGYRRSLRQTEGMVGSLEASLEAKNEQLTASNGRLDNLQNQLVQLREKIAKVTISNSQLNRAISGEVPVESLDIATVMEENRNSKATEKAAATRRLYDAVVSYAYAKMLCEKPGGDWTTEANRCFEENLTRCAKGETDFELPFAHPPDRKPPTFTHNKYDRPISA